MIPSESSWANIRDFDPKSDRVDSPLYEPVGTKTSFSRRCPVMTLVLKKRLFHQKRIDGVEREGIVFGGAEYQRCCCLLGE